MTKPFADNTIIGVAAKALVSHGDDRGFFREIIRDSDPFFTTDSGKAPFGQWSHSKMVKNTVKAWHYHHAQHDWWYVPVGKVTAVLIDDRADSPTFGKRLEFEMGEQVPGVASQAVTSEVCVRIPPGVLHGLRVISDFAHLFYITSEIYNPKEEGRVAFNSPRIGYHWGADPIVAANDRKDLIPSSTRLPFKAV